jgi:hypothetical protein
MWFVTDRDERDDVEVAKMMAMLGDRACLCVLKQRELENYLAEPRAIVSFIGEKRRLAGMSGEPPSEGEITVALQEAAGALKEEVVRLRLERRVLAPLVLQGRGLTGSVVERLDAAKQSLEKRGQSINAEEKLVRGQVDDSWQADALSIVPGTMLLDKVVAKYGVRFNKEAGDSLRLARVLSATAIPAELIELLRQVTREQEQ